MPSYIFNDTLQTYSPGPGMPTGFVAIGLVFASEFISIPPPPPPNLTGNGPIVYALFGTIGFPANSLVLGYTTQTTSVFWKTLGINPNFNAGTGVVTLAYVDPTAMTTATPLSVTFENDGSMSISIQGYGKINSLIPNWINGVWMYCQLNVTVGTTVIGGTTYLTFDAQFAVNGIKVIDTGGALASNVALDPTIGIGVNQWQFTANGYFGEFVATDTIESIPFFPNPGMTINARGTQILVELAKTSTISNARAVQIGAELLKTATNSNARVVQIGVEVMKQKAPITASAIWMDADANLAIKNSTWTDFGD